MLSVCSATPSRSSQSKISFHGGLRPFFPYQKDIQVCSQTTQGGSFTGLLRGTHFQRASSKAQATKSSFSNFITGAEQSLSMGNDSYWFPNASDNPRCKNVASCTLVTTNEEHHMLTGGVNFVENFNVSAEKGAVLDVSGQSAELTSIQVVPVERETVLTNNIAFNNSLSVSDSLNMDNNAPSSVEASAEGFFDRVSESFNASLQKGENAIEKSLDTINSSLSTVIKRANQSVDEAINNIFSSIDQIGEQGGNRLTNFSTEFKEVSIKATVIAIESLRRGIVAIEDSLKNASSFVVYSYGSVKELFPPEIRNALNSSEERAAEILSPIRTGFQQVYFTVEGLEKILGLDPNDPIVPFLLLLGTSVTLWVFYWTWTYSGYSGALSPQSTLELLRGPENAVLIDVRPEVLREKDGIPDLRRGARSRYASVTLPEVDGSIRKLMTSGRDFDDMLVASVIRNLKIVEDRSKVIVMDADGTGSKSIARSLRKLGVKKPYLIQGGFRSWVKQGLRIKELKSETALSILNEEAEAILEEISPSPVQILGYGLGLIATSYALLEWEKSLQIIGVIGLGQTIYWRVASYEDAEDFKKDVSLLFAPVRVGAQALSWAAGKLETNSIGLPTSPSSSDVQNRVLQAAAKHESQPSDSEDVQDRSPEATIPVSESVDLSEA